MLGGRRWVLERKYDVEYCEIHIDLSHSFNPLDSITIFSKSGKNSTNDRRGIHQTLVDCLRLGKSSCKIKRHAIILGELVVYSDRVHHIMPFDEIRKHVQRSGVSLGAGEHTQPHPSEHLAIVFFDILLFDDEVVMTKPLGERRMWLREVYTKIAGRAMSSEWKIVDFSLASRAKKALVQQFAASIAERCEGLILKACDVPYFSLDQQADGGVKGYIKIKKDYIAGMGDEADFAVVGASYHAQRALQVRGANIKWTDFHFGCLVNKDDVVRFDARPRFKVVSTVQSEHCTPRPVLQAANILGNLSAKPYAQSNQPECYDLEVPRSTKIDVIFDKPLVFEVLGSGFEKPSNSSFLMLRHARVKKLHQDRTWKDCVSFQELQEQATASRAAPVNPESKETKRLIEKLQAKCKKKSERLSTGTPRTGSTATPTTTTTKVSSVSRQDCCVKLREDIVAKRLSNRRADPENTENDVLDGTTMVELPAPQNKRSREDHMIETPCPPNKKRRTIAATKHSRTVPDIATIARSFALCDITNVAPTAASLNSSPRVREIHQRCQGSDCLFNNVVVYLAPCIGLTPYITTDLFAAHHDAVITPNLSYWDRDSLGHPPLTATVSESQAYEGARKIVLVESNRKRATEDVVQEVLALNHGVWRERAEVWDWRILEGCVGHGARDKKAERWLMGIVSFDEAKQNAVFQAIESRAKATRI